MSLQSGFAENAGVRIYWEAEGTGPPLLLHHGFTGSAAGWRDYGYFEALREHFRVIALDARGHGRSDKPHDGGAYTMELRTADVAAVLDAVGVERAHYWGYSMGARTGFAMLQLQRERVASFVNGAAGGFSPKQFEQQGMRRRIDAFASADPETISRVMQVARPFVDEVLARNDPLALAAASEGLLGWDGFDAAGVEVPSLHYAGEKDPLLRVARIASERMPNARFVEIPELDHLTGFARSERVLPHVLAFLGEQPPIRPTR